MAINPYDTQAVSGYNAAPVPNDDGTESADNLVSWAKHIDKIGDPILTLSQAINAETLASFGELVITTDPGEETILAANSHLTFE
jgi:hypothetical protein